MICWYHLPKITALAEHEGKPDWCIVVRMHDAIGVTATPGAITAWLHEEHVRAGLEPRVPPVEPRPRELSAWIAIEAEWPRARGHHHDEEPIGS